ncbi:GL20843 [Drosophila persimilis]|uniref:GL20843 n=1 Tax=Drosophila persimilis TaxID=7234 RepID=B4H4B3_DROPE|nr:GL20843 [Drosophila persimilis]
MGIEIKCSCFNDADADAVAVAVALAHIQGWAADGLRMGCGWEWGPGLSKSENMPQMLLWWAWVWAWHCPGGSPAPSSWWAPAICNSNSNNNLQHGAFCLFGRFNGSCRCLFWCNEIKKQKSFYRSQLFLSSTDDDHDDDAVADHDDDVDVDMPLERLSKVNLENLNLNLNPKQNPNPSPNSNSNSSSNLNLNPVARNLRLRARDLWPEISLNCRGSEELHLEPWLRVGFRFRPPPDSLQTATGVQ